MATMAQTRLVNPGKKKGRKRTMTNSAPKRMTLKQKLFFGTPAQRSAAKRAMSKHKHANPAKKRTVKATTKRKTSAVKTAPKRKMAMTHARKGTKKRTTNKGKRTSRVTRTHNIGEIIITTPRNNNPGRSMKMANKRTYKNTSKRAKNTGKSRTRPRHSNPGIKDAGTAVVGVLGGAAVTKLVMGKVVPPAYQVGPVSYLIAAGIAFLQGMAVSKVMKKGVLGASMQLGGFTYVGLKILNDMFPDFASLSPFGLRGALARSSFYTPQVPVGNSLTSFVTPAATMAAIPPPAPTSLKGVRTGRLN